MVILTIRLTPQLTGVAGELWAVVNGNYTFVQPIWTTSVNGVIAVEFTGGVGFELLDYVVIFPEQLVEGVTIFATESQKFKLNRNFVTINVALNVEVPPPPSNGPPPPPPPPPIKQASLGLLALIGLIGLIIFGNQKKK